MSEFDESLRRTLSDDRLSLRPRADAVERIVAGARRRRAHRVVATTVVSAGVAAAVAIGSVSVAGQIRADQQPPVSGVPDSPTVSTEPPDPEPPVLDPAVGFNGLQPGMKLSELMAMDGVEVHEFTAAEGRTEVCYGEVTADDVHGFVSVRGAWGGGGDPAEYYVLTSLAPSVPFQTPEGVSVGSSVDELQQAYQQVNWSTPETGVAYDTEVEVAAGGPALWTFTADYSTPPGVITDLWLDAGQNCVVDEPEVGAAEPVETADPVGTSDPVQTSDPVDPPDALPVLGPDGFGPIRLGMTMSELEQVDGVTITENPDEWGGKEICFGTFEAADVSGFLSVAGPNRTAETEDDYVVTSLQPTVPFVTPEGITVGSTLDEVRAAYPELAEGLEFDPWAPVPTDPEMTWHFHLDGDEVASARLERAQQCLI